MDHSEKYTIEVAGGTVEVYKIKYEATNNKPIILIPGWGEPLSVVKEFASSLARELKRAVCVPDYAKLGYMPEVIEHLDQKFNMPTTEKIRAMVLDEFIKINPEIFREGFIIIAHSEGAITASQLALSNQSIDVSPLILIAPAGIFKQKFLTLLKRFSFYFIKRLYLSFMSYNKKSIKYYLHSLLYIIMNPIQLTRDAWGISRSYIHPILQELKNSGADIYILSHNDDILFLSEEYELYLDVANIIQLPGSHAQVHISPGIIIDYIKNKII